MASLSLQPIPQSFLLLYNIIIIILSLSIHPFPTYIYTQIHGLGLNPFPYHPSSSKPISYFPPKMDEQEESGWTGYFEDFCHEDQDQYDHQASMSLCSSSMVSDASSLPARNIPLHHNLYSQNTAPKKLNFKKKNTHHMISNHHHDDSLEDTASSPVNSPKVVDFRKMEMNYSKKMTTSGNYNSSYIGPFSSTTTTSMGNNSKEEEECTELKKKGLCLVPMSMLLHYVG
ncbi:Vascular-related unknown protein 1 [Linum grandiflorum]